MMSARAGGCVSLLHGNVGCSASLSETPKAILVSYPPPNLIKSIRVHFVLRFWLLKLGPPPPDQAMVLAGTQRLSHR
jgi:hypothetical protein